MLPHVVWRGENLDIFSDLRITPPIHEVALSLHLVSWIFHSQPSSLPHIYLACAMAGSGGFEVAAHAGNDALGDDQSPSTDPSKSFLQSDGYHRLLDRICRDIRELTGVVQGQYSIESIV